MIEPDIVVLDSRAGVHDLAANAVTRLSTHALLFGVDSAQTWAGYRLLFNRWFQAGQAETIRSKIKMVAALLPGGFASDS